MTNYLVSPSKIRGEIKIPPSKSHTLRAILFASLARGTSTIFNYLDSPDTLSMINACKSFGAIINQSPHSLSITGIDGKVVFFEDIINAGNSGIVLRFLTALGALSSHPIVITGDDSIRHNRPMKPLLDALSQLHVSTKSMQKDLFAPIIVKGPLKSGKVMISGEDSQHVSALLIAAAFSQGPILLKVINPGETPFVDLTLSWFDRLKIPYSRKGFHSFHIPGSTRCECFEYTVPGDWSSAAFPISAALITGSEITITHLDSNDSQGDKELLTVFQKMGALFTIKENSIHVKKTTKPLQGCSVDINKFIDAITILSVVACFAEGETIITNGKSARHKECNRIKCIQEELQKMGADIQETDDGLIIKKSTLHGATLLSHNDHRMALSLAIAALGASSDSIIENITCISKTFPSFLQDFRALGAHIK